MREQLNKNQNVPDGLRAESSAIRSSRNAGKNQRCAQALHWDEHRARDVLASAGLREERVERIVTATDRLVRRHLAIRLDTFDDDAGA